MFKLSNTFSGVATLALAFVPALALAGAVQAAPMSVSVGDLSSAAGVATFEQRIDKLASNMCDAQAQDVGARMVKLDGCREAVRAEAIEKLSTTQRRQIAAIGGAVLAAR